MNCQHSSCFLIRSLCMTEKLQLDAPDKAGHNSVIFASD